MKDAAFDEVIYPKEIEFLFTLVDSDQNNEISEAEFVSASERYKKVANFLRINLLEEHRLLTIQELTKARQNLRSLENNDRSELYVSLMDEKSLMAESSEDLHGSICQRLTPVNWLCKRYTLVRGSGDTECQEASKYRAIKHFDDESSNPNNKQIIVTDIQKLGCMEDLESTSYSKYGATKDFRDERSKPKNQKTIVRDIQKLGCMDDFESTNHSPDNGFEQVFGKCNNNFR